MLIEIRNYNNEQILSERLSIPIDNLLRSFRERKHILISNKSFFETIRDDDNGLYNHCTKQTAHDAMKSQSEYAKLINLVSFYVVVDFDIQGDQISWIEINSKTILKVGPNYFEDSSKLQSSSIILENINDYDFYHIILSNFTRDNNINKCQVGCNIINGGGGTTKEVFEHHIENDEIILCLLDNDKKHPRGPIGSTSKAFGSMKYNRAGMIKILDVHEVESLIPVDILEMSIDASKNKTLAFLKNSLEEEESIKFYFDHKKGLELKTAFKLDKLHGSYWIPLLKSSTIIENSDCLNDGKCSCNESCIIIDGLGDNILSKAVQYINKGNLNIYKPHLSPKLDLHWTEIGKLLFSWCCGPYKKSRVT
jgi:hypothetical protein